MTQVIENANTLRLIESAQSGGVNRLSLGAPIYFTDATFIDRGAVVTLRRATLAPTGIIPTVHVASIGRGNNASFIGVSGGYFQSRDEPTVDATTKGVLYGLQLSVVPNVARNNIPFDDVAGLVVQNDTTVVGARGTDAIYVGRNSASFPGDDAEWLTGCTVESNASYGFRSAAATFVAFNASGRMRGVSGSGYGFFADSTIQSSVTTHAYVFRSEPATQAASFTLENLRHFIAAQRTFGAGSTVTNQFGFTAAASLVGAANNFGFRADLPAGANNWNFYTGGDASSYFSGRVLISTSPTQISSSSGVSGHLQISGNGQSQTSVNLGRFTADASAASLYFSKSRSSTVGGAGVVSSGDSLGFFAFDGSDGTGQVRAASITVAVDAAPGAGSMPGRIVFATSATGSGSPTTRMTLDSLGHLILANLVSDNFADDTAAAAGGVPVGGLYHNAGAVRVRRT